MRSQNDKCSIMDGAAFPPLSQDELAQVLALKDGAELVADELAIDDDALLRQVGALVADLLDDLLQDGVQPAGADVLVRAVDLEGDVRDRLDPVLGEFEFDPLGLQQLGVLLGQGVLRLGEDAEEVGAWSGR